MDISAAGWSPEQPGAGRSLPARYFFAPEIWDLERVNIFHKSWQLVGHVNELAGPGSFLTHDFLDQSVIVMVGRDEVIRAFHNVCQHRGNRLIEARRGETRAVVCGYHAWTYTIDGALQGAPRTKAVVGFDRAAHGLKPVRLEVLGGFVFVNLDPDATPLAETVPGAEAELRRFIPDLDQLELVEETDVPVAANWKVIQENAIEGYHFEYSGPAHKELAGLIDFSSYTLEPRGAWWTYVGAPKPGTTHAYGAPLAGATWQTDWFFNLGLWPNATIYVFPYSDVVGTFIMTPTGPESSVLRFGYYGPRGRARPDATKACIRWMNEDLGPEDIRLNVSNQKGLHSLGFQQGHYLIGEGIANRSEHLVRHFHELCYRAVQGAVVP